MAVNRVGTGVVLRLVLQTGVGPLGKPIYRNKNLSSIKPDAADQDLFDVAQVLAGLQEYTLNGIIRIQSDQLIQV